MIKKVLTFIYENFCEIFVLILLLAFIVCLIYLGICACNESKYELEEKCYSFYKENNYVLEECSVYENKLRNK